MNLEPDRTLNLKAENFDIGVGFFYGGTNKSITPDKLDLYFNLMLNTIDYAMITDPAEQARVGSTYYWNKTKVPLVVCDESRFANMTDTTSNLGITGTYFCP